MNRTDRFFDWVYRRPRPVQTLVFNVLTFLVVPFIDLLLWLLGKVSPNQRGDERGDDV